ncbi:hypothetical protein BH11PSE7_BH11PSE7_25400 [soil metagenome]
MITFIISASIVLVCAYLGFKVFVAYTARARAARAAARGDMPTMFADGAPDTVLDTQMPPDTIPSAPR